MKKNILQSILATSMVAATLLTSTTAFTSQKTFEMPTIAFFKYQGLKRIFDDTDAQTCADLKGLARPNNSCEVNLPNAVQYFEYGKTAKLIVDVHYQNPDDDYLDINMIRTKRNGPFMTFVESNTDDDNNPTGETSPENCTMDVLIKGDDYFHIRGIRNCPEDFLRQLNGARKE